MAYIDFRLISTVMFCDVLELGALSFYKKTTGSNTKTNKYTIVHCVICSAIILEYSYDELNTFSTSKYTFQVYVCKL